MFVFSSEKLLYHQNVLCAGIGFKRFDAGAGKRFPKLSKSFVTAACFAKSELLYQDFRENTTLIPAERKISAR